MILRGFFSRWSRKNVQKRLQFSWRHMLETSSHYLFIRSVHSDGKNLSINCLNNIYNNANEWPPPKKEPEVVNTKKRFGRGHHEKRSGSGYHEKRSRSGHHEKRSGSAPWLLTFDLTDPWPLTFDLNTKKAYINYFSSLIQNNYLINIQL